MKAAKKLYFDIPGLGRVHSMPGAQFDSGGVNRAMKKSDQGFVGHTEEHEEPKLKFKIARKQNDGVTLKILNDLVDTNITVIDDLDNTFIFRDGFTTKPVSYSDGDFDVEASAYSVEEVS